MRDLCVDWNKCGGTATDRSHAQRDVCSCDQGMRAKRAVFCQSAGLVLTVQRLMCGQVGVRLVGSGLICTCTKAGRFQAVGGETAGKSSCFLLEMGHQGAAFLTPNKR
jgi:hypothetical protein